MTEIIVHVTVGPLVPGWVSVELPLVSVDTLANMTLRHQCRHLARMIAMEQHESIQLVVKTSELAERLLLYACDSSQDKLYFVLHDKGGKDTSTTEFDFDLAKFLKEFNDETVSS